MASPPADLIVLFRGKASSKQKALDAENAYTTLLETLRNAGLKAVGKKGAQDGQVMVFVCAPEGLLANLVQNDRYREFINGVPTYTLPSVPRNLNSQPLTSSERIRYTYDYLTAPAVDGGLGIAPGAEPWRRVEGIMALHDRGFNERWLHSWTSHKLGLGFSDTELEKVKNEFGEQLALYFAFVSFYAKALVVPTGLGIAFWAYGVPYHPLYSGLLCLWSIVFVEWWRLRERAISVRWGSYGTSKVELRRAEFQAAGGANDKHDESAFPWWKREARIVASLPVVAVFSAALTLLLTGIFVVEAFMTQLYTGPGVKYISLVPTALFLLLVPRLVGYYQTYAVSLSGWENHVFKSSYDRSLALKTFALSSIVAYGGLYLSAFVYVPFGEEIMHIVQSTFFTPITAQDEKVAVARKVLNADRLKSQVFAYLVTNQVVGEFMEIGLPAISRWIRRAKNGDMKKRAEKRTLTEAEALLVDARKQVALPEYDVFGDYSEMVTQFGYCVLWSTCWTLAPVGALVNNWVELRGDAIKIATMGRRPIPRRVESIGPWMEILTFLTWQGALINSALVYLFYGGSTSPIREGSSGAAVLVQSALRPALLIALSTSHAYLLVRALVRHVLVRAVWRGSEEEVKLAKCEKETKRLWLNEVGGNAKAESGASPTATTATTGTFWEDDEGLGEVRKKAQ
ncbi:hypothetical protein FRB99_005559 [Tulasnella sp. 403]|nr:hypothetical protein FRB99_005559 [Tulasnella sp. 403]